ncbi:hypothetical protein VISI1226_22085 [Vibrio sinaloensis DSM 21326]|uniref:ABM domain-containing protein n=1 Tax=Vibrio sinaloensis DSM 21326 TaxID=945550 RepID=E8M6I7_PHOS4|nr:antibiotic biosynthesis monooxygenase [Vibrio sinaloensis]EGA70305.1 hypothetical protein VISI1226_22085 [Vibrio sinaloensis DSM 21326]
MSKAIFVTAELRIKPDVEIAQAREKIRQFCQQMESEPGCQQATASYDLEDDRRVILWERYDDQAAIEAHFNMPHTHDFIALSIVDLVQAFNSQIEEK